MVKNLTAICICSLFAIVGAGQAELFGQTYGLKGGLTFSNIMGEPNENIRLGTQIGAWAKLGGNEVLYFKPELMLTQKGSLRWDSENRNNIALYYMDIALMFGIEIYRGFSLNLGFQPSILLYANGEFSSVADGRDEESSGNITSRLTTMDYSTLIGVEYFIKDHVYLGMRYNHGFVPIQSREGTLPFAGRNPTNMTFQIFCGIRLRE